MNEKKFWWLFDKAAYWVLFIVAAILLFFSGLIMHSPGGLHYVGLPLFDGAAIFLILGGLAKGLIQTTLGKVFLIFSILLIFFTLLKFLQDSADFVHSVEMRMILAYLHQFLAISTPVVAYFHIRKRYEDSK